MSRIDDQLGFRTFAGNLEQTLLRYEPIPEGQLLYHQRNQLRELVATETALRKTLIDHPWGPGIYRDFVQFICDERRNILAARPYFRERQDIFSSQISGILKKRREKGLYKYRFNWTFIAWLLSARKWPAGGQIRKLANKIQSIRQALLEQNLPLAISQARIFWNTTPKSHLTYMDIVQIQCQGLLLAIDKFVPPTPAQEKRMTEAASLKAYQSFRAVAIGIMRRDRVNSYSETSLHFFPPDRQKIYRANKHLRKFPSEVDYTQLAKLVNKDLQESESPCQTNPAELMSLLAASSTVSGDFAAEPEGETVIESTAGDNSLRPDTITEQHNLSNVLYQHINKLPLVERKLLKMKGIYQ
jgi:DNA-directed RNA polymerase specialized sigma subunit